MAAYSDISWEIPDPEDVCEVRVDSNTSILLRRHGNRVGTRLVMSHGNGLAIDLYYPFWSRLCDDFDLVIYDLRNHGWNGVSPLEDHNIPTLVADHDLILAAIDEHFGKKTQVGVFHSVSALISLLSSLRGERFSAMVLYDPPICKPGRSLREFEQASERAAAMARRRTDKFKVERDFSELLPFFPPFQQFEQGVFELMAKTTLRMSADGTGYELRCPRDYEAQMVDYAGIYAVAVDFDSLQCPVKVIGADPTLPYSYLPTLDLSDILSVDYDFLPEATHFLQLEKPAECAAALKDYLGSIRLA